MPLAETRDLNVRCANSLLSLEASPIPDKQAEHNDISDMTLRYVFRNKVKRTHYMAASVRT